MSEVSKYRVLLGRALMELDYLRSVHVAEDKIHKPFLDGLIRDIDESIGWTKETERLRRCRYVQRQSAETNLPLASA